MNFGEIIKNCLNESRIYEYGICRFEDAGALLECKNSWRIPANSASIITVAIPYYTGENACSNLCRYARVPDYHKVVMKILNEVASKLSAQIEGVFASFCDISALPEKLCAVKSGIGFLGKNGLVINENYGSYFVIGELVTDAVLPYSKPNLGSCFGCNACSEICPAAILGKDKIEYDRCLSSITQKKDELLPEEKKLITVGKLAWGCDKCQEVCPHNRDVKPTHIAEFYENVEPVLTVENMSKLRKTRAFGYRSTGVLKRNLELI